MRKSKLSTINIRIGSFFVSKIKENFMKDKIKSYLELLFQAVLLGAGVMIGMTIIAAVAKVF